MPSSMNIALPMIIALCAFAAAYFLYAPLIARLIGLDPDRTPPAVRLQDDVDYVPTKRSVVFSHHFASIAGGGPILGPTLALIYGYQLTFFWIVIGCIFFGAVHDFVALYLSVREDGRSIAEIARRALGKQGFFLFLSFTLVSLIMVIVVFLGATVAALTSTYPIELMGLAPDQTLLNTVVENGVVKGKIGGIATTSVFVITGFAPLMGFLLYRKKIPVAIAGVVAVCVCFVSMFIGLKLPIVLEPEVWRVILCLYVMLAAGIPVWVILQPRDFTNSFILYIGIAAIAVSILVGGALHFITPAAPELASFAINAPASNVVEGAKHLGIVWPFLFITVACGAISGFHSLVAGGTSSKQICSEGHAKSVGYGAMLLEGVFAVGVLCVVASGMDFASYKAVVFPVIQGVKSNPILAFALALGNVLEQSVRIPRVYGTVFGILLVEGFVVTTLDTSVRLCRYLIEELWNVCFKTVPTILKSYLFNAALIVGLAYFLSLTNSIAKVWPIFGAANQLLAAMVLIIAAVWLSARGKQVWFVLAPAVIMLVTAVASLAILLVGKYLKSGNIPLVISDLTLLALAIGFIFLIIKRFLLSPKVATTIEP